MNRKVLLLALFFGCFFMVNAQKTIEGISNTVELNITKEPPVLILVDGSLKFSDPQGNNAIMANQKATISFEVMNKGKGDASGMVAHVTQTGRVTGLTFSRSIRVGGLAPGARKTIQVPITGEMELTAGTATFDIKLDEDGGFGLDDVMLDVKTLAFASPLVKVPDFSITSDMGNTLVKKRPFDLQLLVQNVGKGRAEDVDVTLVIPQDVLCISSNLTTSFSALASGETKTVIYSLIVNEKYGSSTIPVEVKLREHYDKYSENKNITLQLNQSMATKKLVVESKVRENKDVITEASLTAEVDKQIPVNPNVNVNTYALIIGNENYADNQPDINSESNVDFARNDASVFASYCKQTLGIPADNVKLLTDATAGKMQQQIDRLKELIKNSDGNLQVVFYYAGHGLPDESTHEPYLIPVDVSGKDISRAVKIADVYRNLTEFPSKGVTVFLDACFSGGGRNKPLMADRAIRIPPKDEALKGRIAVFAASKGSQTSSPYKSKQHGMFTYYLLKKLQDTKGDVSYLDLASYITEQVKFQAVKINEKEQEPQMVHGEELSNYELAKVKLKDGFK